MNLIIENPVEFYGHLVKDATIMQEFNTILSIIRQSSTEKQIRNIFKGFDSKYFLLGFGGNHMWVKQIIGGRAAQQVIFLPFSAYTINSEL